jgi:thiol-disulfide isomerase/thioredoxin
MNRPRLALVLSAIASVAAARTAFADDPAPSAPATPAHAAGVEFEPGSTGFDQALAKAKAAGKPVFVDFSTEWCGWCKRLDRDVFTQAKVADAMKAFVNVHVDAEKGEGVDLAKRYGVHGFPTLLVVDSAKEEIDRIVGYMPAGPFETEVRRIARGEGTLPALRARVKAAPDDLEAALSLAGKETASAPDAATPRFEEVRVKAHAKGDRGAESRALRGLATLRFEARDAAGAMPMLETLVTDFAGTEAAEWAAQAGTSAFRGDPARTLAFVEKARASATTPRAKAQLESAAFTAHLALAGASLRSMAKAAGDDPEALNEAAWRAFQHRIGTAAAIEWAKKAVETLANLLAVHGGWDAAIELELEAAERADGELKAQFQANVVRWVAARAAARQYPGATAEDLDAEGGDHEDGEEDEEHEEGAPPAKAPGLR